jgi:hypothetical protein
MTNLGAIAHGAGNENGTKGAAMNRRTKKFAVALAVAFAGQWAAAAGAKAALVTLPAAKITAAPPFSACNLTQHQFILDASKVGCGGKVVLTGPGWAVRAWPGMIRNDFWYLSFYDAPAAPDSTSKASFYPGITVPGLYDVWVSWRTSHNRATAAPFYIWADDGKTYKMTVNQKGTDGFRATKLGTFFFKTHIRDKALVTIQNNEGTHSKSVDALFVKYVGPQNAKNLTASDAAYPDHVELKWSPVAGASGYRIYRSATTSVADATPITTVTPPAVTYDDPLDPEVTYNYWVRVVGALGKVSSGYSNMDTGSTSVLTQ